MTSFASRHGANTKESPEVRDDRAGEWQDYLLSGEDYYSTEQEETPK